ncbi:hypothetical protein A3B42_02915 [Candidatus Daviesbacteria bacterium RIFCSPLOWO2_01_FULL_38_10]|nr:MAG: hypothetical protein A3D02_04070 [Candidatus Daviesbacteria bacterium RIFCSPHIGHO2_02_FULL_39_41]OGE38655.1 MAG: hypothetical protein A3B42_02915 [Candidatus Daviesbacteria bacterium RIFCSPLOWO2_01_FULL_38_10]OGE68521.1 MAG: hypothetical protein A3H81_02200 [Candidatus Daviesbacteria bacterium RIFCSPLOWO2_02_FULL_38_18]OGE72498.1 MAG: hypothetical protein A3H18_03050 [Candidatus Daviesbacteria bacterium RIFCSPLOWO2_12_FULL_38_10]HBQ50898.1 hypothetical protein [Candidatus Daviesbacteria
MIKILQFNLLLTVFLIPIITPFQSYGYELSRILFFIFLTSLSGFLWLWLAHRKKIKLRWNKVKITSLIFVIILLFTSLLGIDPVFSLLGKEPYFQGWVIYVYLWLFSVMVATTPIEPKKWIIALSLSSIIVSFVAIRQFVEINFLGHFIPAYAGRVVSTFGQPNFYSGFLLLTLPFIPRKGWWPAVIGLNMVAIFLSESRAAMIILLLMVSWWFLAKFKNYPKKLFIPIILLVLLFFPLALQPSIQTIFRQEQSNPESRYYIWPVMGKIAKENFFRGIGLENIDIAWSNFFEKINWNSNRISSDYNPFFYNLKDLVVDRAHIYFLDVLLFSGIIGLLGYIGLISIVFIKMKSKILISSLLIYLVWSQFQNQSIVHLIYFWLLVGLVDESST